MSGMSMMLKSMGIDPEAMQKQFAEIGQTVVKFKEQLDRIENKLDAVLERENDGRSELGDGNGNAELGNDERGGIGEGDDAG